MSEYRCTMCGELYQHYEYLNLPTQSVKTDDPNDKYGVEPVCDNCGAGFTTDKWHLDETVEVQGVDVRVSTVGLLINHGFVGGELWYETCIFISRGESRVVDRYRTEREAAHGHALYVNALKNRQPRIDLPNDFAFTLTE